MEIQFKRLHRNYPYTLIYCLLFHRLPLPIQQQLTLLKWADRCNLEAISTILQELIISKTLDLAVIKTTLMQVMILIILIWDRRLRQFKRMPFLTRFSCNKTRRDSKQGASVAGIKLMLMDLHLWIIVKMVHLLLQLKSQGLILLRLKEPSTQVKEFSV